MPGLWYSLTMLKVENLGITDTSITAMIEGSDDRWQDLWPLASEKKKHFG